MIKHNFKTSYHEQQVNMVTRLVKVFSTLDEIEIYKITKRIAVKYDDSIKDDYSILDGIEME